MSAISPDETADPLWFVRRGDAVRGPLHWRTIEKDRLLGRIQPDDEICGADGRWLPVAEQIDGRPAWTTGVRVYTSAPDNPGYAPAQDGRGPAAGAADPARVQVMRVSTAVLARRARAVNIWASLRETAPPSVQPLLAVALVLLATILVAIFGNLPRTTPVSDCQARLTAGGNWDFCTLTAWHGDGLQLDGISARNAHLSAASFSRSSLKGADLSYADLTRADLSLADLPAARLVGARLQYASLNHARLRGADLRFADLSGADLSGTDFRQARLGHALWSDGRVCARGSVGACRTD